VNRNDQLQWEARWARPAAGAAFASAVTLLVSSMAFIPDDRPGIERNPDFLLSIDERPGAYLTSTGLYAIAGLLLVGVFLYLFRAVMARGGGVPRWFIYLVIGAPVAYSLATVGGAFEALDVADQFVDDGIIRGEKGTDHANDLSDAGPALVALATAGKLGLAFLFVMLPLRARRVGLLTPFMGILGVIGGLLFVFPQFAALAGVMQAFWLGALAALFAGVWPGGRGPAWETGEPTPWPTAAQRRANTQLPELDPSAPPAEPEPVPERPASRKRRKKRKR
jgi:hypothetical protein